MRGRAGLVLVLATWAALAGAVVAVAAPRVGLPGLFYDEAFMAAQARDFVEPRVRPHRASHPPGVRSVWVAGRPFPLMNVAYLGALKSQLTVPAFALFGARVEVLRLTTLGLGLLAILCTMLWARALLGAPAALATGALLASDPTTLFLSLYEWGPFTVGFLCRAAGLWLVTTGWSAVGPARMLAGAFVLGLGIYSRVDFVVFLAGAALALVAVRPQVVREALGPRRRRVLAAAGAGLLGMAPTLAVLHVVLDTVGVMPDRGGLPQKLAVLRGMLDGSYFFRLMEVGGRFDALGAVSGAPSGPFGAVLALAFVGLGARELARGRRGDPRLRFLLLATLFVLAGMLALPGATRVHHLMNVVPLPQLVVAAGLAALAAPGRARAARTAAAAALLAAVVVGQGAVTARTFASIEASGGRGYWSDALGRFARELPDRPGTTAVSLDWGFHEPLQILTDRARLEEPIWSVRRRLREGRPWRAQGDPRTVYLLHEPAYDVFGLGPRFLEAVEALPPEAVERTPWRDREGEVAFLAVRLRRPHRLVYDGAAFHVFWRGPMAER